jgi:ABC-2 type transport system permease protein
MNRFFWLIRREIWEHKAIWIAPAVALACIILLMVTGHMHLDPFDGDESRLPRVTHDQKLTILTYIYAALALPAFVVMGIIAFFYSLDSLYADRRDRSVLFWKSLPLSDAETVLSKFAVAVVAIPLVALAMTIVTQLLVAAGESVGFTGMPAGFLWEPEAILGGIGVAAILSVTAMFWYAPLIGYLMLASAWAPRAPFLWAVLPPAGAWILEKFVMRSDVIGLFIADRVLVLPYMLRRYGEMEGPTDRAASKIERMTSVDLYDLLGAFFQTPALWLGVLAAALLLAAAMWVRRYRDETA